MAKKKRLTATDLTIGEKLILNRWRQNLSQVDMAADYEVSLMSYRAMENDDDHIPGGRIRPDVAVGRITAEENAVILRLRSGMTQGETCADMGVTRYWLRRMEKAEDCNTDRLLKYWDLI